MFDKQSTSNKEILSQIDSIFDKLNNSGAHACYCKRSEDGGCECALKDEYMREVKQVFAAHLQTSMRKARIASVQLYIDTCEKVGVPPSWRNLREFQRGQEKAFAELYPTKKGKTMYDTERRITIQEGGISEFPDFDIVLNYQTNKYDSSCSHSVKGSIRVIEAKNEGGYSGTLVCLDCIIKAADENGLLPPTHPVPTPVDGENFICPADNFEHRIGQNYDERRGTGNGPQICLKCKKTLQELVAAHLQAAVVKEQDRIAEAIFNEEQKANAVLQKGSTQDSGYTHLSGRIVGLQRARDIVQRLKKEALK